MKRQSKLKKFKLFSVKTTYKKIKINSYSFPEHVPISEASRSILISYIVFRFDHENTKLRSF
jgi:hypothetical protein